MRVSEWADAKDVERWVAKRKTPKDACAENAETCGDRLMVLIASADRRISGVHPPCRIDWSGHTLTNLCARAWRA